MRKLSYEFVNLLEGMAPPELLRVKGLKGPSLSSPPPFPLNHNMALAPAFSGARFGNPGAAHTLELYRKPHSVLPHPRRLVGPGAARLLRGTHPPLLELKPQLAT